MLFNRNETISVREGSGYIRLGDRKQLTVKMDEPNITYRKIEAKQQLVKVYNKNHEMIALEYVSGDSFDEKVITDIARRTTVVIIMVDGEEFKGVSKCHPSEWFDIQKGYRIAKNRARMSMLQHRLKEMTR